MYQYFNQNPDPTTYNRGKQKGKKKPHSDCVVRALMQAWRCDWREAYMRLAKAGCEIGAMPSEPDTWRYFCYKSKKRTPYIGQGRKLKTVAEFAKETEGDQTGYIVHARKHLVFVQDGVYRDSWDSGDMAVVSIWEAE